MIESLKLVWWICWSEQNQDQCKKCDRSRREPLLSASQVLWSETIATLDLCIVTFASLHKGYAKDCNLIVSWHGWIKIQMIDASEGKKCDGSGRTQGLTWTHPELLIKRPTCQIFPCIPDICHFLYASNIKLLHILTCMYPLPKYAKFCYCRKIYIYTGRAIS